jgi:hypothetical protein
VIDLGKNGDVSSIEHTLISGVLGKMKINLLNASKEDIET